MSEGLCGKCAHCDNKGSHWHHIIPKSRGGSDAKENLVFLCLSCHSLAHDVSFKGGNGIVSDAIQKAKVSWGTSADWWADNTDTITSFFMVLLDDERTIHDFLLSGIELGIVSNDDIRKLFTGVPLSRSRKKLKKEHGELIHLLWKDFTEGGECEQA